MIERLQVWLESQLDPLTRRFEALQPRERVIVVAGGVAVLIGVLYFGILQPMSRASAKASARLEAARQVAIDLETVAVVVPRSGSAGRSAASGSLLSIVDQASKSPELGKPLSRLQPDGDTQVHAWVENVSFDNLMRWMYALQSRYGVAIESAEIERQPTAGEVNARLALVRGK
jgi:general secretion pathway protein M